MRIQNTPLAGVKVLIPQRYTDKRGGLVEQFQLKRYKQAGIVDAFVQCNFSYSKQNVIRGLHTQIKYPQGKLVFVTYGTIFDVVVDICPHSPTFKQHYQIELSAKNGYQLWIPPGYAHGFMVLSKMAHCHYFCTQYYNPDDQAGVNWQDTSLNIPWPRKNAILSERDRLLPSLETFLLKYYRYQPPRI